MHFLNGNSPKSRDTAKRYYAVLTLKTWLQGKTHLPKDLLAALYFLIPELGVKDLDAEDSCDYF